MWIKTDAELDSAMESGAYTTIGGYPKYYITEDTGCLCHTCVEANLELIKRARVNGDRQWNVIAMDVNYDTKDMFCDNCYCEIEIYVSLVLNHR